MTSRFQFPPRQLLYAKARLYFDRIELTGWHFGDKYHQVIPLREISHIAWPPQNKQACNMLLHFENGSKLGLLMDQVQVWRRLLTKRMPWDNRASRTNSIDPSWSLEDHATLASTLS